MKTRRLVIFLTVIIVIPLVTYFIAQLAKGYRPDLSHPTVLKPTGLLVATSQPKTAQIYVAGALLGTTDTAINLDPGNYDVEIRKDLYQIWRKNLKIEKELVTQTNAYLFPSQPENKQQTFSPTTSLLLSPDHSKAIFATSPHIPPTKTTSKTIKPSPTPTLSEPPIDNMPYGIYTIDLSDSPLNFNKDPKLIATNTSKLDWSTASLSWSPDSRQLLAVFSKESPKTIDAYLLDPTRNNPNPKSIFPTYKSLLNDWQNQESIRTQQSISKLPRTASDIISSSSANLIFSPDESKLFYTATSSATLPDNIIPDIIAANSQPQQRNLITGNTYVYDLKEDKNFTHTSFSLSPTPVSSKTKTLNRKITPTPSLPPTANLHFLWFPTSRHLISVKNQQIIITEYDNTNPITIAFPYPVDGTVVPSTNGNRLFVLAKPSNLQPLFLYSITLKP